jgi:hypothetical protein
MTNKKKFKFIAGSVLTSALLFGLFQNFSPLAPAPVCSSAKMAEILAAPTTKTPSVQIDCSFQLKATNTIKKQLVLEGSKATGVVVDCNGGKIETAHTSLAVLITSLKGADNLTWVAPKKVHIKNCIINGSIRTVGMATNGEGAILRESSRIDANHTARAQASAPSEINLENLTIQTGSSIPLYIGPGSTKVRLYDSRINGKSPSVAVYMDAESAQNQISNNVFEIASVDRELIAIDGSANNLVSGNVFKNILAGGVFIYRNCGEGGTIRHQKPSGNIIRKNKFYHQDFESINVGSRKANSIYCSYDAGFPYGSSANDFDFAENTTITGNTFYLNNKKESYFSRFVISSSEQSTSISDNTAVGLQMNRVGFMERVFGKYTDAGQNISEVK